MTASDLKSRFTRAYWRAVHDDLGSRPGLSREARFAVIVGALVGLRLPQERLTRELGELLDNGCSAALAEDTIVHLAAYAGYMHASLAVDALVAAMAQRAMPAAVRDDPLDTLTDDARYQRGIEDYGRLNASALGNIRAAFDEVAPDVAQLTFRAFGDVFAVSRQPLTLRQLATVAALIAMGTAAPQVRFHIAAAFNVGVTREEIVETIYWLQIFAGMPAAYNALVELKAALAAGAAAPPAYR